MTKPINIKHQKAAFEGNKSLAQLKIIHGYTVTLNFQLLVKLLLL